jgi:hypothetical protein
MSIQLSNFCFVVPCYVIFESKAICIMYNKFDVEAGILFHYLKKASTPNLQGRCRDGLIMIITFFVKLIRVINLVKYDFKLHVIDLRKQIWNLIKVATNLYPHCTLSNMFNS